MAQPIGYTPTTDFSNEEAAQVAGRSTVRTAQLDAEFANIETTLDQTLANLALIQRDDGGLANESVGLDQLKSDVTVGLNFRGNWVTATAYAGNDAVQSGNAYYRCVVAHTSGAFAADLAAAKWVVTIDLSASVNSADTSATAAATSAANSANSATASQSSAAAAAASEANAAASYDSFDDRYLGPKSSDPTLDNDGNALIVGAMYFNTVANNMRIWTGSAWGASTVATSSYMAGLLAAIDAAAARAALGLSFRGAFVTLSASQTLSPSVNVPIAYDSEVYDTDNIHDNVTNKSRLTVPTGVTKVKLLAEIHFNPNSTGVRYVQFLKNNGNLFPGGFAQEEVPSASFNTTLHIQTPVLFVTAGDWFEVTAYQSTAGNLNLTNGNFNWFAMEIIP